MSRFRVITLKVEFGGSEKGVKRDAINVEGRITTAVFWYPNLVKDVTSVQIKTVVFEVKTADGNPRNPFEVTVLVELPGTVPSAATKKSVEGEAFQKGEVVITFNSPS